MKVLHITTNDFGGAGLAVLRIHRALINQGVESRVLVSSKHSQENYVYEFRSTPINAYKPPQNHILRKIKKILRKRGYFLTKKEQHTRSDLRNKGGNGKKNSGILWRRYLKYYAYRPYASE